MSILNVRYPAKADVRAEVIIMAKNERTSKSVASKAAKILRNPKSTKAQKSVAASALTQAADKKKR